MKDTLVSLKENLETYIDKPQDFGKIFFYVGGVGFESEFVDSTKKAYEHFKKVGFSDEQVKLIINPELEHNEKAWRRYFPEAIRYFNYLKDK